MPGVPDFNNRRPFCPVISSDGFRGLAIRPFRESTLGHSDILLGGERFVGLVLQEQDVFRPLLDESRINHVKTLVIKYPGFRKFLKVFCCHIVNSVIAALTFYSLAALIIGCRESSRDRGGPENQKLLAGTIKKYLGRPAILCLRFMLHDRNIFLFRPVDKGFCTGISN